MLLTLSPTLQPGIRKMANLFTIKHRPLFPMKNIIKILYKLNLFEINKSISNIALKLKVDRKIEEVKLPFEFLINQLEHQFLVILIRYVLYHNCSLNNLLNNIPLNLERLFIMNWQSLSHILLINLRLNST
jgi:hypothetical protein